MKTYSWPDVLTFRGALFDRQNRHTEIRFDTMNQLIGPTVRIAVTATDRPGGVGMAEDEKAL